MLGPSLIYWGREAAAQDKGVKNIYLSKDTRKRARGKGKYKIN
jgi:hypothetical protein